MDLTHTWFIILWGYYSKDNISNHKSLANIPSYQCQQGLWLQQKPLQSSWPTVVLLHLGTLEQPQLGKVVLPGCSAGTGTLAHSVAYKRHVLNLEFHSTVTDLSFLYVITAEESPSDGVKTLNSNPNKKVHLHNSAFYTFLSTAGMI